MTSTQAILVTGSHRSGTTWVGRTLAAFPPVVYFQEPFNVDYQVPGLSMPVRHWFAYVCVENEQAYYPAMQRMLGWRVNPHQHAPNAPTAGAVARLRDALRPIKYRWRGARALIKDPIALLSASWLAARFKMRVVVMIRHPAAFASSLKLLNWSFPFAHFLQQPLLMRDHLQPFEAQLRRYAETPQAVLSQATLLWTILHTVIRSYQRAHPDWIFVRHEDLSRDPVAGFRSLYEQLDLDFAPRVAAHIQAHTQSRATADTSRTDPFALKRDSRSNVDQWKSRLSPEEIEAVRQDVGEVAQGFYSDDEW